MGERGSTKRDTPRERDRRRMPQGAASARTRGAQGARDASRSTSTSTRPSASGRKRSKPRSEAQKAAAERRRARAAAKIDQARAQEAAAEEARRQEEEARAQAEAEAAAAREEEARRNDPELKRKAMWRTDDSNIYLAPEGDAVDEDWFEDEEAQGVVPVRDVSPSKRHRTPAKKHVRAAGIVFAIFAGIAILGLYAWFTRTVEFTLNGDVATTHFGTTLADYLDEHGTDVTPGNLVSVTGEVLQEGQGHAYTATVNGLEYLPEDADGVRIGGGEEVEVANGGDVMEDYDVEVVEAPPLLEFQGEAGAFSFISQWGEPGTQELRTGKISGLQATGDYVDPPKNTIVTTVNVEPDTGIHCVALTFDDGPSEYTDDYLDILAQYDAKATFFMKPEEVIDHVDAARAVKDAGHQIATKTDAYDSLSNMDDETMKETIQHGFDVLENELGVKTTVFRPLFGAFTHTDWLRSDGVASMSVIWNCDSLDWEQPGTYEIVQYALEGLGNGSVILLHDGGGDRSQTLAALPILLTELQNQGYSFVTIDELLKSDSSIPPVLSTGDETMPADSVWPEAIYVPEDE